MATHGSVNEVLKKITVRNNPRWPPELSSLIVAKSLYYKEFFIGRVKKLLDNGTLCLIELENNKDYQETYLGGKLENNGMGVFLLFPNYAWTYIDDRTMNFLLKSTGQAPHISRNQVLKPLMDDTLYPEKINDDLVYNKDDSILDESGKPDLTKYKKEKDINDLLTDNNAVPITLSSEVLEVLKKKLEPKEITEIDQIIVVNKSIAIDNLITDIKDEIHEGKKIIKWVKQKFVDVEKYNIFNDLRMHIANGYVHIARTGMNINDTITESLIPDLQIFRWQYGIPVDYDSLKYVLVRKNLKQEDIDAQKEAEKILSQEFIISLQPKPKYQIWCLKRIIMAWYADVDLRNNIRKVKVLINQWRTKNYTDFNKKYGVLPSIVVYPKYGKRSSRIVADRLTKYFLFYSNIAIGTTPTWFVKLNDLISYTNGNINIQIYKNS